MDDFWSDIGKGVVKDFGNAGADILRNAANRASKANNADVTPEQKSMAPWMIYAGAAMAVLLVFVLVRKR